MDTATVRYDKDGDDHYDVISAFINPCGAPIRMPPSISGTHAESG